MNHNEVLAKYNAINGKKGPRPKLGQFVDKFLTSHAERLSTADLTETITRLTAIQAANAAFDAQVHVAKAEEMAAKAAEMAAKAAEMQANATPATPATPAN